MHRHPACRLFLAHAWAVQRLPGVRRAGPRHVPDARLACAVSSVRHGPCSVAAHALGPDVITPAGHGRRPGRLNTPAKACGPRRPLGTRPASQQPAASACARTPAGRRWRRLRCMQGPYSDRARTTLPLAHVLTHTGMCRAACAVWALLPRRVYVGPAVIPLAGHKPLPPPRTSRDARQARIALSLGGGVSPTGYVSSRRAGMSRPPPARVGARRVCAPATRDLDAATQVLRGMHGAYSVPGMRRAVRTACV